MRKKFYTRAFSTILSVLTVFSGVNNTYGVKAVRPEESSQSSSSSASPNSDPISAALSNCDKKKLDELVKLVDLLTKVSGYCNIKEYKWDDKDQEAIKAGASKTLDETQKKEIEQMFEYVRSHSSLLDSLGLSVLNLDVKFISPLTDSYKSLRDICQQVGTPTSNDFIDRFLKTGSNLFGFSLQSVYAETNVHNFKTLFILYRVPRADVDGGTQGLRGILLTLISEILGIIQMSNRLGHVPYNELTAQLQYSWNEMFKTMTGDVDSYVLFTAEPYIREKLETLKTESGSFINQKIDYVKSNILDVVNEKTLPEAEAAIDRKLLAAEAAIDRTTWLICCAIVATCAARQTISLGFKYIDKKCFGSPAEKCDKNETKQPKQTSQKSQQPTIA